MAAAGSPRTDAAAGGSLPAQLGFLAIFNPSLGTTDETADDQILYYASSAPGPSSSSRHRGRRSDHAPSREERHERLRQIGLIQAMADFGRGFADAAPLDVIETKTTRALARELEPGWWILASIDLARLPLPPRLLDKTTSRQEDHFEYSSRDVKPAALLLRDLLRAHGIFLLHHAPSLSSLFAQCQRTRFVALLGRYWDLFLSTWVVTLHGNPARDVYHGINLAGGGELGVGVGEEHRGSGEREVLEGLVGRIDGLVDLVVSKFGDGPGQKDSNPSAATGDGPQPWLGTGRQPAAQDGAIFLGTGALSRTSIRDVTDWMEDIYTWGEHAYGIVRSARSARRTKPSKAAAGQPSMPSTASIGAPADLGASRSSPKDVTTAGKNVKEDEERSIDKMLGYMKLGYGSYWTFPGRLSDPPARQAELPTAEDEVVVKGYYLIGLKGLVEEGQQDLEAGGPSASGSDSEHESDAPTVLRTLHVELQTENENGQQPASEVSRDRPKANKTEKLRVVVYVNQPFIFTFLFRAGSESLEGDGLYRSLHHQLAPLKKALVASTKYRPARPDLGGAAATDLYSLVWDPLSLTVRTAIPNIPDRSAGSEAWTRSDAINTHLHLVHIRQETQAGAGGEIERSYKTNRGWWIVWTRLPEDSDEAEERSGPPTPSQVSGRASGSDLDRQMGPVTEILLLRRASDHVGFRLAGAGADGAGKLAQGIGVDTRRYVEELLSLL